MDFCGLEASCQSKHSPLGIPPYEHQYLVVFLKGTLLQKPKQDIEWHDFTKNQKSQVIFCISGDVPLTKNNNKKKLETTETTL